ncbi:MAG: LysR family transcriptional regulator [Actinomycetes bacterium]
MLNPVHLKTLTEVIRTGSFAAAARRLGYTASAVSQQMSALERAAQLPLFDREPHSIRPTAAAELLAQRSVDVLASLAVLDEEVDAIASGRVGRLQLGSFATASARVLPQALAAFARGHPDVEIRLDEGEPDELLPLLQVGDLDVVLVYRYDLVPRRWPRRLLETELLHERLLALVPDHHELSAQQSVALDELASATWIAPREGTAGAACLARACAAAGFAPRIAYRSNDYDVVQGLVRSGLGVAVVPALAHDRSGGSARALPLAGLQLERHVSALSRPESTTAAVTDALAALQEAAAGTASAVVRAGPVTP